MRAAWMIVVGLVLAGCDDDRRAVDRKLERQRHEAVEARRQLAEDEAKQEAAAAAAQNERLQAELLKLQAELDAAEKAMVEVDTDAGREAAKARIRALQIKMEQDRRTPKPKPKVSADCANNPLGC